MSHYELWIIEDVNAHTFKVISIIPTPENIESLSVNPITSSYLTSSYLRGSDPVDKSGPQEWEDSCLDNVVKCEWHIRKNY